MSRQKRLRRSALIRSEEADERKEDQRTRDSTKGWERVNEGSAKGGTETKPIEINEQEGNLITTHLAYPVYYQYVQNHK